MNLKPVDIPHLTYAIALVTGSNVLCQVIEKNSPLPSEREVQVDVTRPSNHFQLVFQVDESKSVALGHAVIKCGDVPDVATIKVRVDTNGDVSCEWFLRSGSSVESFFIPGVFSNHEAQI